MKATHAAPSSSGGGAGAGDRPEGSQGETAGNEEGLNREDGGTDDGPTDDTNFVDQNLPKNAWDQKVSFSNRNSTSRPVIDCFPNITNKNAITIPVAENLSNEEVCLAISKIVKPSGILACGRMNGSILVYLKNEADIPRVCAGGIGIKGQHVDVNPLVKPSVKVTLSNVRPDMPNSILADTLATFGTIVSDIRPISANLRGICRM